MLRAEPDRRCQRRPFRDHLSQAARHDDGIVFEIAKTPAGSPARRPHWPASTPKTRCRKAACSPMPTATCSEPRRRPTTAIQRREVFEIKKTAAGYASTPTTLVIFTVPTASSTAQDLIADAKVTFSGRPETTARTMTACVRDRQDRRGLRSTPTILATSTPSRQLRRRPDRRRQRRPFRKLTGAPTERHGVRDCEDRHRVRQRADHAV